MENKIQTRPEPFNWSTYERTGNNAIDLVAQCIGYHRRARKPLKSIILKPGSFDLFRAGLRVLMAKKGQQLDDVSEILFDGVTIERGTWMQFDTIRCIYYPTVKPVSN